MNLSKMTENVENITNQPNQIVGKASDIKKIFDKGNADIKNFLNEIHIPELLNILREENSKLENKIDKNTGKISELINDGDGKSPFATTEVVDGKISELVDSSPDALNTLFELALALGNDPNFATTILNLISTKVDKVSGKNLSTNDYTTADKKKLESLPTGDAMRNLIEKVNNHETSINNGIKNVDLGFSPYWEDESKFQLDWNYYIPTATDIWNACSFGISIVTFDYGDNPKYIIVIKDNCGAIPKMQVIDGNNTYYCEESYNEETYDVYFGEWVPLNYSKTEIDDMIGDIDNALDELHNYARFLISGGAK